MIRKVKKIKARVKELLTNNSRLRESDNRLIARIWQSEIKQRGIGATEFLRQLSLGRFTSPESIRRARQKIQEEYPELRGSNNIIKKELAEEMRLGINH